MKRFTDYAGRLVLNALIVIVLFAGIAAIVYYWPVK
jgi:hypothetical protein